jgi:hypothetical protein
MQGSRRAGQVRARKPPRPARFQTPALPADPASGPEKPILEAPTHDNTESKAGARAPIEKMLHDLAARIEQIERLTEAFVMTIAPNGQHTLAEHNLRLAFGVLLDRQLDELRDIGRLVRQVQS